MGARPSKLARMIGAAAIGGKKKHRRRFVAAPPPKGYVPVCVGINDETKRFIVHATLLREDDFLEFLVRAAEEFGFCNEGVLRIPYETREFEEWVFEKGNDTKVKSACQSRAVCLSGKKVQVLKTLRSY